jgi:hypothetical protein
MLEPVLGQQISSWHKANQFFWYVVLALHKITDLTESS